MRNLTDRLSCKPFLRWPGGKRWLAATIADTIAGLKFGSYFEPFLGGGAVFFAVRPTKAVLSDINADLVNTYSQVRRVPGQLIKSLKGLPVTARTYQILRDERPRTKVARAVRFLYLNRTAFAGMYRLNQNGEFNVPYGGGQRRPDVLWQDALLTRASAALQRAELRCADFEEILVSARPGDLVYCDPTYTVAHNNNGFIRYNESNFRWSDQQRLARMCSRLQAQGTTVLVSNAYHHEIRILYPTARVLEVDRLSLLCPNAEKRKPTKEYLFLLKP